MSLRCSSKNSPSWITWAFPTIFSSSDGSPASRRCVVIPTRKRPRRLKTLEPPWFQAPPKARGHLATRWGFDMNHESQVVARHFPAGGGGFAVHPSELRLRAVRSGEASAGSRPPQGLKGGIVRG